MKAIFGICLLMASVARPVNAGQQLTLYVTPAQSFAPSFLMVRARIEPRAANRVLRIVADGEDYYRSSEIALDGEAAPRVIQMPFRNVPGGRYDVYAVLTDGSGRERAVAHQLATVISPVSY